MLYHNGRWQLHYRTIIKFLGKSARNYLINSETSTKLFLTGVFVWTPTIKGVCISVNVCMHHFYALRFRRQRCGSHFWGYLSLQPLRLCIKLHIKYKANSRKWLNWRVKPKKSVMEISGLILSLKYGPKTNSGNVRGLLITWLARQRSTWFGSSVGD